MQNLAASSANILEQLNSTPMYLICGGIVAFVAIVCLIFLVRAYKAGVALGMDTTKMKRVIVSSATFSVLPRNSSRSYCSFGQSRNSVAMASSFGYRRLAL